MTTITLATIIKAPIERCFDLSRCVDVHLISTGSTQEKVVGGKMSGLMLQGDTVTWEAVHFGVTQRLTSEIVALKAPFYFSDKMVKGAFKSMYHEHHFSQYNKDTTMKDIFSYETPYGIFGKLFDALLLRRHMTMLLTTRNEVIKNIAEGSEWATLLK